MTMFREVREGVYQGKEVFFVGKADQVDTKQGNGEEPVLQGKCAIMGKDGSYLIEGYFKGGKITGPSRLIKLSKRKPGCYTVREGRFQQGVETGL